MGTLRQSPGTLRAIARLWVQGTSKSAIARELGIDRQTVTRSLRDPRAQAEIHRLEQARAAVPPAIPPVTPATVPTPVEKQYKVPLDVVPWETRRITYWELKAGRIQRETLNPVLLEALGEYNPNESSPAPATVQPERPPNRRLEEFVDAANGTGRRSSRRTISSVPPWLRPAPELDFWD